MHQYFAATTTPDAQAITESSRYKNILVSFFYYKQAMRELCKATKFDNFFFDSGAFSFKSKKNAPSIDDYMAVIKQDGIKNYSVFDVIGNPGATKDNYLYMKHHGLQPVPCFHINTDINYLYWYLDYCDTLSIGGMVMSPTIRANLDKIWSSIINRNPTIKVHGFGVSSVDVATAYPWNSIDSSSYSSITKFARALEWQHRSFQPIDTFVLMKRLDLTFDESGKLSTKGHRNALFSWQIEQYNLMIDYVNQIQENRNFNYLTAQATLF